MAELKQSLTLNDQGDEVAELHQRLGKLGYKIPAHEIEGKLFGVGTKDALLRFQQKQKLRVTGRLDARSDILLARTVATAGTGKHRIEGRIYLDNGAPAAEIALRVTSQGFGGSEQVRGETKTDAQGYYTCIFDVPEKPEAIELQCLDAQGTAIPLTTKTFVEEHKVLNLVAPAEIKPLAPEYDRLTAAVKVEIESLDSLADAKEDGERRDLSLLHQATGWDARLIALLATAVRVAGQTGVPVSLVYALLRVGLPSDTARLCLLSDKTIDKALLKAAQANVAKLDRRQLARGKQAFARFSQAKRLETKVQGAVSSIGELLDVTGLDTAERKAFETLYFSHKGTAAEFWQKAEAADISPSSITRLKTWRKLNQLTRDNAPLTASLQEDIATTDELEKLVDQGLYKPEEWKSRIQKLAGDDEQALAALLPSEEKDLALDARLDRYTRALAAQVSESFRTPVIGAKVKEGELARDLDGDDENRALVGDFLRLAPNLGYRLGTTPIDGFLRRRRDRLADIGVDPARLDAVVPHLKRLHRLYQITPSDAALKTLDALPYTSAAQIAAIDPGEFIARHGAQFPSAQEARRVSAKAQQVATATLVQISNAMLAAQGPAIYGLSGDESARNEDITRIAKSSQDYPTIESLFGSVDFCECEHCRSMLSPAAYFVDLLRFLEPDDEVWGRDTPKPFSVLEGRRPDLPHLALTCENTQTALPYIDVVNEILEYAVAHEGLSGDAAHDTGEATTPELLAEPHYIEPEAYNRLRNPVHAMYPLGLPFDLWLETVRAFLDHFEVPLWRVLDVFRGTDALYLEDETDPIYGEIHYSRAAVLLERVGLSRTDAGLLCASPALGWHALYGEPGDDDDLHGARTLARRLGVTYKELVDIVRTRFVNPELHQVSLLWRLGIDPSDALEYLHPTGSPDQWATNQRDFEDKIESVLAEMGSDLELANVIEQIRALDTTSTAESPYTAFQRTLVLRDTSAQCRFDETFLRFADEPSPQDDRYGLVFVKLNLLVRLWKRLGWTIEETDQALFTFLPWVPDELTKDNLGAAMRIALVRMGQLKALEETADASRDDRQALLTLWSYLATTGANSLYARLFLTPSMRQIDPIFADPLGHYLEFLNGAGNFVPFRWDSDDPEASDDRPNGKVALKNHLAALQAGLGLTADEIGRILADAHGREPDKAFMVMNSTALTLETVSVLHRYGLLARLLRVSISDLIALKAISGLDPFLQLTRTASESRMDDDPIAQSLGFVEVANQIRDSAFDIEDLDYLLRHRFDSLGKYRDASAPPLALLRTLGAEIRRIRTEHPIPADPNDVTEDMLRNKLALALPPDVAETLIAMWLGTVEYEAMETEVEQENALEPARFEDRPYIRISYDPARRTQRLIVRGVPVDSDLARLKGEVSSGLSDALTAHYEQARSFFVKHLQRHELDEGHAYGFLEADDFDTLFARPRPVTGDLPPGVIKENKKYNDQIAQKKHRLLVNAFLPYLQQSLVRQAIIDRLSTELGADPTFIEALLVDGRLLDDPTATGKTLLHAFEPAGEAGVSADYEPVGSTSKPPIRVTRTAVAPDTRLLTPAAKDVRFGGYLEVPANGTYRFSAEFEQPGGSVELHLDNDPDPLLGAKATESNIEDGIPSSTVELKAGVPYRFDLEFRALNGTHAELLIEGENLPKGPLSRLVLYPQAAVERLTRGWLLLSKALQIAHGFGLSERELRYLLTHAEDFEGLDLRRLPTLSDSPAAAVPNGLFRQFMRVADYARLRDEMAAGEGLIDVFEHARRETGDADTVNKALHAIMDTITRRDSATVKAVAEHLGLGVPVVATEAYPLVATGFTQEQGVRRLWDILQICEQLGVSLADIKRWATPTPNFETARDLKNTVKSRYRPEDWQRVAQPISDRLRRRKRDALVAYLVHEYGFQGMEELFEQFLIDPGMEPVVQTSRIQLAIASVQTFVQRCLLNLEPAVSPSAIDGEEWKWKKNYRVWEANRKIFLYPENLLEPEFRDDKTHLFQQLESALLQGDIDNDSAEAAILDYLRGLQEIAKLDIVTSCIEEDQNDATAYVIHVIGRTANTPHRYFYRQYSSNDIWTPWEPVTVDIEGDHVAAMVWKSRLHLFWVTFLDKSEESGQDSSDQQSSQACDSEQSLADQPTDCVVEQGKRFTHGVVQAKLSWAEYFQGQWSEPESSELDESISAVVPEGGLDRKDVFIHATKEIESDGELKKDRAVRVHLDGHRFSDREFVWKQDLSPDEVDAGGWEYALFFALYYRDKTAFRLFSKNSAPTVIGRLETPEYPYRLNDPKINVYKGSGGLSLDVDLGVNGSCAVTTGQNPSTVCVPTAHILKKGAEYSLQVCPRGAEFRYGERESILSPFFYWDQEHLFFARPYAELRLVPTQSGSDQGDPWNHNHWDPDNEESSELVEPEPEGPLGFDVLPQQPPEFDMSELDIPYDILPYPPYLSEESKFDMPKGIDWLRNGETVLDFQGYAIGRQGGVDPSDVVKQSSKVDVGPVVFGKEGLSRSAAVELQAALGNEAWRSPVPNYHGYQ